MNLTLRYHTSDDYAKLPDMADGTVGVLDANDQACLKDLGSWLVKTGYNSRFGISLLHNHFQTSDDELFVQTTDQVNRSINLKPVFRDSIKKRTTAVNIQFEADRARGALRLIGLEYLFEDDPVQISPIDNKDTEVLSGLKKSLENHAKLDRFGVRIINYPIALKNEEVYFETCDLENRTLTSQPANKNHPDLKQMVETFWVWKTDEEEDPTAHCPANCVIGCHPKFGHPKYHIDKHKGPG